MIKDFSKINKIIHLRTFLITSIFISIILRFPSHWDVDMVLGMKLVVGTFSGIILGFIVGMVRLLFFKNKK